MNLADLKKLFRRNIKVVPGGPAVGTPGNNRAAGVLDALDKLAEFADARTPETAALVATIVADRALVYEVAKGLTQAEQAGFSLAITTAAGTNVILPTTQRVSLPNLASTYDSATGWLYLVLPAGIDVADVLSVYLHRPLASGARHILAADLRPFGGGTTPPTTPVITPGTTVPTPAITVLTTTAY